jgi:glycosyltransferase involved in cell wall biosynthesis
MHADPRTILFRRDFHGLTGGHLKVWDYFCHARHSARFEPRVFLTPESVRDHGNPWCGIAPPPLAAWRPDSADVLFLAGLDWEAVPVPAPAPVINLIQGLRHADPDDPRHRSLSRPAVRICVSDEVAAAIRSTSLVNGPIHVIPNGIDTTMFPKHAPNRDIPLLIAGQKDPAFAAAVMTRLAAVGIGAECLTRSCDRTTFLGLLGRARVAVLVPFEREGFFLPAIEAMAMGALVVCPDCLGNRGFCRDGETCFLPDYTLDGVVGAAIAATVLDAEAGGRMRAAAEAEVARHGIGGEREAFLSILDGL